MDMNNIGAIVATDAHGSCSWLGEAVAFFGRFDADPTTFHIGQARMHLVDAIEEKRGDKCPDGYMHCIALKCEDWSALVAKPKA